MIVKVDGHDAHAATGGNGLADEGPVVILIHGAGMDATVWSLQTRYLAYRDFRVVAVDLPGHGRSAGEPLTSVGDQADWLARFCFAAGFESVNLVGHSMGTFIAMEVAARHPELVTSLVLMGTSDAMGVHPELLDHAENDLPAAAALMAAWAHSKSAHVGQNPTPGLWMTSGTRALVERSAPGVLATDFKACVAYGDALTTAGKVTCPVTVMVGHADKMTPRKAAMKVVEALSDPQVIDLPGVGHQMMNEEPRLIRKAITSAVS
jgi:pimeloyl-ACP methyl ester carboxylesterase